MQSVFDFEMKALDGTMVPLSRYRGRVLLIVNVASRCAFTKQYAGLEALYRKFFPRGFEVLGFPCNQFLWEEPADEKAIGEFCKTKYDVTFPLFAKVRVNGFFQADLFRFLKRRSRGVLWTTTIKWNFTKFLVNRQGKPIKRFGPLDPPVSIEPLIAQTLEEAWPKKE